MQKTTTQEENLHLIEQKLAAFDAMQPEFAASFRFMQEMHGQRRFELFKVADAVYYLHARWVNDCKGRLLSVAKTSKEYEGRLCLELLQKWQEGDTASVVAFLSRKLDMSPLVDITRQLREEYQQQQDDGVLERLVHGRLTMLNRGINLLLLLDALFAFSEEELLQAVRIACVEHGHMSEQITQQLQEMDSPLYSYVPHQLLAQRNMLVMNVVGIEVLAKPADLPGNRSWRVTQPVETIDAPYAEHVVEGYQELVSPTHNNIKDDRFVDHPERDENGEVV